MISSDQIGVPVDDGAVSCADLDAWEAEFEAVRQRVDPLFRQPGSRTHARYYLRGLGRR